MSSSPERGPQEVAAAVIVERGRVLMCHRHPRRPRYPDIWDLPGGHIEHHETPEDALVRELDEELGITVDPGGLGRCVTITPEPGLTVRVWFVHSWKGRLFNRTPDEHDEIGWFTPAEVVGLKLPDPVLVDLCRHAVEQEPTAKRSAP